MSLISGLRESGINDSIKADAGRRMQRWDELVVDARV